MWMKLISNCMLDVWFLFMHLFTIYVSIHYLCIYSLLPGGSLPCYSTASIWVTCISTISLKKSLPFVSYFGFRMVHTLCLPFSKLSDDCWLSLNDDWSPLLEELPGQDTSHEGQQKQAQNSAHLGTEYTAGVVMGWRAVMNWFLGHNQVLKYLWSIFDPKSGRGR